MKLGPRLFSTGTILYGAETPFKAIVNDLRGRAVDAAPAEGVRRVQREELQPAAPRRAPDDHQGRARAADGGRARRGLAPLLRTRRWCSTATPRSSTRCRCRGCTRTSSRCSAKSKTGYTPTLIVGYGGLSGEYYWYQKTNVWENERLLAFTPREVVDARSRRRTMAPDDDFNHVLIAKGAKQILDAGGTRAARRARPAAGARRALGAVDAAAGRA